MARVQESLSSGWGRLALLVLFAAPSILVAVALRLQAGLAMGGVILVTVVVQALVNPGYTRALVNTVIDVFRLGHEAARLEQRKRVLDMERLEALGVLAERQAAGWREHFRTHVHYVDFSLIHMEEPALIVHFGVVNSAVVPMTISQYQIARGNAQVTGDERLANFRHDENPQTRPLLLEPGKYTTIVRTFYLGSGPAEILRDAVRNRREVRYEFTIIWSVKVGDKEEPHMHNLVYRRIADQGDKGDITW